MESMTDAKPIDPRCEDMTRAKRWTKEEAENDLSAWRKTGLRWCVQNNNFGISIILSTPSQGLSQKSVARAKTCY